MKPISLLCPCCAARLEVPPEVKLLLCRNCNSQLAVFEQGGVCALIPLPADSSPIPYSDGRSVQAARDGASKLDTLEVSASLWQSDLDRRFAALRFALVFRGALTLAFLFTMLATLVMAQNISSTPRAWLEVIVGATVGCVLLLVLLSVVLAYLHDRVVRLADACSRLEGHASSTSAD